MEIWGIFLLKKKNIKNKILLSTKHNIKNNSKNIYNNINIMNKNNNKNNKIYNNKIESKIKEIVTKNNQFLNLYFTIILYSFNLSFFFFN